MNYRAPVVGKAFQILELVSRVDPGLTLSDLSRKLRISKSTMHGIIAALEEAGAIIREKGTKRYSLGPTFVELGRPAQSRLAPKKKVGLEVEEPGCRFQVNEHCNGCLACVQNCPARALDFRDEGETRTLLHNLARCARCGTCWRVCPQKAVEFGHLLEGAWSRVVELKLLRCSVCGEVIHPEGLLPALPEKVRNLAEPLCQRHRLERQARSMAHRPKAKEGRFYERPLTSA